MQSTAKLPAHVGWTDLLGEGDATLDDAIARLQRVAGVELLSHRLGVLAGRLGERHGAGCLEILLIAAAELRRSVGGLAYVRAEQALVAASCVVVLRAAVAASASASRTGAALPAERRGAADPVDKLLALPRGTLERIEAQACAAVLPLLEAAVAAAWPAPAAPAAPPAAPAAAPPHQTPPHQVALLSCTAVPTDAGPPVPPVASAEVAASPQSPEAAGAAASPAAPGTTESEREDFAACAAAAAEAGPEKRAQRMQIRKDAERFAFGGEGYLALADGYRGTGLFAESGAGDPAAALPPGAGDASPAKRSRSDVTPPPPTAPPPAAAPAPTASLLASQQTPRRSRQPQPAIASPPADLAAAAAAAATAAAAAPPLPSALRRSDAPPRARSGVRFTDGESAGRGYAPPPPPPPPPANHGPTTRATNSGQPLARGDVPLSFLLAVDRRVLVVAFQGCRGHLWQLLLRPRDLAVWVGDLIHAGEAYDVSTLDADADALDADADALDADADALDADGGDGYGVAADSVHGYARSAVFATDIRSIDTCAADAADDDSPGFIAPRARQLEAVDRLELRKKLLLTGRSGAAAQLLRDYGMVVIPEAVPLDRPTVDAIRKSLTTDSQPLAGGHSPEHDGRVLAPTQQSPVWRRTMTGAFTDVLGRLGLLSYESRRIRGQKEVVDVFAIRTRPGCERQALHADWARDLQYP